MPMRGRPADADSTSSRSASLAARHREAQAGERRVRMRAKGPRSLYKPRFLPGWVRDTARLLFARQRASTRVAGA